MCVPSLASPHPPGPEYFVLMLCFTHPQGVFLYPLFVCFNVTHSILWGKVVWGHEHVMSFCPQWTGVSQKKAQRHREKAAAEPKVTFILS